MNPPDNTGKSYRFTPKGPRITLRKFLKAIKGSAGILGTIAKRMGVTRDAVSKALVREKFAEAKLAFEEECHSTVELAEKTVRYLIHKGEDHYVRGQNARWMMERTLKKFSEKKEVTLSGGETPIKVQSSTVDVDTLPLDLKRQLLATIAQGSGDDVPSTFGGDRNGAVGTGPGEKARQTTGSGSAPPPRRKITCRRIVP